MDDGKLALRQALIMIVIDAESMSSVQLLDWLMSPVMFVYTTLVQDS